MRCNLDGVLVPHPVEIVLQARSLKVFGRVILRGLILPVVALLEFLGESLLLFLIPKKHK